MQQPAVPPFVSTVVNRLDAKGRVSIPAAFRQILAQQNLNGVYCIPSFAQPALEAFGETLLAQFQQRLDKYDALFSEEYDDEAQAVLGRAQFLKFDDEGRVTLPGASA
jgi:MraZ protein